MAVVIKQQLSFLSNEGIQVEVNQSGGSMTNLVLKDIDTDGEMVSFGAYLTVDEVKALITLLEKSI
jgi:hypothetical protein